MRRAVPVTVVALLVFGAEARAQSAGDALRNLLFEPTEGGGAFSRNGVEALYGLLLSETTTFPITSSAGGFTWTFDSALNVPRRRTQSFGPMFADRPFTIGEGRINFALTYQHTAFDSVAGQPLDKLEQGVSYNFGESQYKTLSSVAVSMDRILVCSTVGGPHGLEATFVLPISRVTVSGNSSALNKEIDGTTSTVAASSSGTSTGLGDVLLRYKQEFLSTRLVNAAAGVDFRFPTGSADKLLGTGHFQTKLQLIASATAGQFSPHVNVGYTFGGSGMTFGEDTRFVGSFGDPELLSREPSPEFDYTFGADVAATPLITIAGDVIGRTLQDSARLSYFDSGSGGPDRLVFFKVDPGSVTLLLGAVGTKINVAGRWLLTATVLFPLNDNGIKARVTPVIGFELTY